VGSGVTGPDILTSVLDGTELSESLLGRFTKGKKLPYKFSLMFIGSPRFGEEKSLFSLPRIQLPLKGNIGVLISP